MAAHNHTESEQVVHASIPGSPEYRAAGVEPIQASKPRRPVGRPPRPDRVIVPGNRFGRWTVISGPVKKTSDLYSYTYECVCECGAKREVERGNLLNSVSRSCGCLKRENNVARMTRHSMTGSRVHTIWMGIIARCTREKFEGWKNYGGRGITVCQRWRESFEAFLEDMGQPPSQSHSIDRFPDNNGNYEPGNCRWATQKEQCRNIRKNKIIEYKGVSKCISEWAEELNVSDSLIRYRINSGWDVERAFTTPANKNFRSRSKQAPTGDSRS